ncbi:MAG: hypothetical protein AMXMBFR12_05190 [Candidatus Babeliales bacterium]
MKKNYIIMLLAICAGIPLVVGLRMRYHEQAESVLDTSIDVEAIAQVTSDADGDDVIDTDGERPSHIRQQDFDDAIKRKQVIELVHDALEYIKNNSFDKAMNAFTHGRDFIRGELYLFVYDTQGFEYANGQDERFVWKNLINLRDSFGTYLIQDILKKAREGGGWVTYQWRNATKNSYIQGFTKEGKEYALGAGYYPHSKHDVVVGLVKAAVSYFNDVVIKKGFLVDEVFSTLSYPAGRFVMGDLYLYAVDFNGRMMANGDRPGLIGTNVLNVKDAEGKLVNQEIINRLKTSPEGEGVWVDYVSKNAVKSTYSEKVQDLEGNSYFIACGYYPTATPSRAVDLVKDGYEFLKKHGLTAAIQEFSSRQSDTFRYGDLHLVLWNMNGKVMAHGANLDSIGLNQWDLKDEDGKFYVREIIDKANHGGGWVDFKLKNAFQSIYVERVDLGSDNFVIGSGLYPISKRETALLLVRSAASFLRNRSEEEAFTAFSDINGKFIRGDLFVFVIGFDGIAKVWGDNPELTWRNIIDAKDDTGKPYVQVFINTVKQGPGQVTYRINGFERVALLEMVEKDGQQYVVGTGYYI